MEKEKLISFTDPLLKKEPERFDFEKEDAKAISERLLAGMKQFGGVGLSANQIGLDMKVFVIGGSGLQEKAFFNPELLTVSQTGVTMREGCLSYPGLWLNLTRPDGCVLKYQDESGEEVIEEFGGVYARVVLHEYDHMVGQNFTMRASSLKIQRALKALDKKVLKHYNKRKVA
jgi:peptide deformylase